MGDGADLALDNAFDDFDFYHSHKHLSNSEKYDLGLVDEHVSVIGRPWDLPVSVRARRRASRKPSGPGPCPKCGKDTVLRKNKHTGAEFYGCTGFPHCMGNRNSN